MLGASERRARARPRRAARRLRGRGDVLPVVLQDLAVQLSRPHRAMSRTTARIVLALTAAFFAVFFLWPVLQILRGGFIDADGRLTFAYLGALLTDPTYVTALRNSFLLACAGTAIAMLIAMPLAYISDRFLYPLKGFLNSAVLVPMILPPFVGAIGIKQIFGQYGAVNALIVDVGLRPHGWTFDWFAANQFWGVAIVEALSLYPIIYLNAVAALANIDPAMEEAAQNLGCTGLRRFRRITLPLIRPGLFAGCTIVFIWVFTELGTPLVFDYSRVTSVQIFYGLKDIGGNPFPYALVAVMLASSVLIYAVGKGLFGQTGHAMMATAAGGARALPAPQALLCTVIFCGVTMVAILPHLGVVLIASSKDWYASALPRGSMAGRDRYPSSLRARASLKIIRVAAIRAPSSGMLGSRCRRRPSTKSEPYAATRAT